MSVELNNGSDYYTFDNLVYKIDSSKLKRIEDINSSNIDKPWIVGTLLYSISDSSPYARMYTNDEIKELTNLLIDLYDSSWNAYFDISTGEINIEKLITYDKQDRYKIDALNGVRVATVNEVNEGIYQLSGDYIIQLVNDPTIKIEESEYKFINLFTWAMTGRWRYYIRAGYNCEFVDGKLKGSDVKYIYKIAKVLFRMCELLKDENYYNNIIDKLKNIKKLGGYKYPAYADDEIQPDDKFLFVVNQISKMMPKNKTPYQFEAYRILKNNRNIPPSKYSVEDKIKVRRAYCELKYGKTVQENIDETSAVNENKALCDKIRKGVADGLFSQNEFAIKIVGTLSKSGYRNCSEKQRGILIEAINKINSRSVKNKQIETVEDMVKNEDNTDSNNDDNFSIAGISDLLGRGMMFNG